jgi:hypothetical protein
VIGIDAKQALLALVKSTFAAPGSGFETVQVRYVPPANMELEAVYGGSGGGPLRPAVAETVSTIHGASFLVIVRVTRPAGQEETTDTRVSEICDEIIALITANGRKMAGPNTVVTANNVNWFNPSDETNAVTEANLLVNVEGIA